jgi:hypothetical protein
VVNQSGYHVTNQTIDVIITNQPFTTGVQNGNVTALYYNVEHKGHFEDWLTDLSSYDYVSSNIQASTSGTTLVSFPLQYWNIPAGGLVDFRVRAVVGYTYSGPAQYCGSPIISALWGKAVGVPHKL